MHVVAFVPRNTDGCVTENARKYVSFYYVLYLFPNIRNTYTFRTAASQLRLIHKRKIRGTSSTKQIFTRLFSLAGILDFQNDYKRQKRFDWKWKRHDYVWRGKLCTAVKQKGRRMKILSSLISSFDQTPETCTQATPRLRRLRKLPSCVDYFFVSDRSGHETKSRKCSTAARARQCRWISHPKYRIKNTIDVLSQLLHTSYQRRFTKYM